jgi:uncharacterized protein YjdB
VRSRQASTESTSHVYWKVRQQGVSVGFQTNSPVRFGVTTKQNEVEPGTSATVVAVVLDGATPISGATIAVSVTPTVVVDTGVVLTGWQQVSKTDLPDGEARYVYSVALQRLGSPFSSFSATTTGNGDFQLYNDTILFGDVAEGETKTCLYCLEFLASSSQTPPIESLVWKVQTELAPIALTLADSTPEYPLAGDGIYTGTFVAATAGEYWIEAKATGTAVDQRPFARQAGLSVSARQKAASFLGFQDAMVDRNGDGKPDTIRVTATVHVNNPGKYSFAITLRQGDNDSASMISTADLAAGTRQISVDFSRTTVLEYLRADGPYERTRAILKRDGDEAVSTAEVLLDAGTTQSYTLQQWKAGRLHVTGSPTLTPLNLQGTSGYDTLRLEFAIESPVADVCLWEATLTDPNGGEIQRLSNDRELAMGQHILQLDYNGAIIARHGVNGPFRAASFLLRCGTEEVEEDLIAESAGLNATDFANGLADYQLVVPHVGIAADEERMFLVQLQSINGFAEMVDLSIASSPPEVNASIGSGLTSSGGVWLTLSAGPSVAPGTHNLSIHTESEGISRDVQIPVVISASPVEVTVSASGSTFIHPGMTRQFQASVAGHSHQGVTWAIEPITQGSISPSGHYEAPVVIPARTPVGVVASSEVDASRSGISTILLLPPVIISLNPDSTSLRAGESTWIYASLEHNGNTFDPSLTWTSVGPTGSLSKQPLQARYTAPATITTPQTVTIRATFAEDPAALAEVMLTLVPSIDVSLAPTTATLRPNETQAFTATVTNDPDDAGVTWELTPEIGAIDPFGVYTAPAEIAAQSTVTLRATSVSDPLRSATAIITLEPSLDPRMTLSAPVTDISLPAGSLRDVAFTLTAVGGFTGEATLSVVGLPTGANAEFLPGMSSTGGSSLLRLQSDGGLAEGSYPFTLQATLPDRVVTLPLQLTVIAAPPFTVVAGNPVGAVPADSAVTFTVEVAFRDGWTGWVVPSVVGLPSGATATFSPPSRYLPGYFLATVKPAMGTSLPRHPVQLVLSHLHDPTTLRSTHLLLLPDEEGLPTPWAHTSVAAPLEDVRHQAGSFSLQSAGSGIEGTTDSFQFVHQPTAGDFTLVARVAGSQSADAASKVGLMVRDSFQGNERMLFLGWDSSGSIVRIHRATAGSAAVSTSGPAHAKPYWLKLVRSANSFRSFVSADGLQWSEVGTPLTLYLPWAAFAGFAAADEVEDQQAVFNEVQFAPTAIIGDVLPPASTIEVSLAPTTATLRPNETQAFTATVTNDPG